MQTVSPQLQVGYKIPLNRVLTSEEHVEVRCYLNLIVLNPACDKLVMGKLHIPGTFLEGTLYMLLA
jgi:hypothetical protein